MGLALLLMLSAAPAVPDWRPWTPEVFDQAAAQQRFVLLDVEAVWCHWCHVMDETTYRDPRVVELLEAHYLTVKVDQDAAPELANRYGAWGWPATIVLAADGTEIVKRRGYLPPSAMASLLQAIVDDPSPGPSVEAEVEIAPAGAQLSQVQRRGIRKALDDAYDRVNGGWGEGHRLVQAAPLELALGAARAGDANAASHARQTLLAARKLIDPVWGGVYQYSDQPDWLSPHFEKIVAFQAAALELYSEAYELWGDEAFRVSAHDVERYLVAFLTSPEGSFYASQDADLSSAIDGHHYYPLSGPDRRKLGLPAIDRHVYPRENGWAIAALVAYYEATGEADALARALAAAQAIVKRAQLADGSFGHGAGPGKLGDTVAMGRAFLSLYQATADRSWLDRASRVATAIETSFGDPSSAGFVTSQAPLGARGVFARPVRDVDENVAVARFANLLAKTTGRPDQASLSDRAMRYLSSPGLLEQPGLFAEVLLADEEISSAPLHVAVVGHKDDPKARSLFAAALALPGSYKRVDFWDPREGPLPDGSPPYPADPQPAAYACGPRSCSPPVASATALRAAVARLTATR